MKRVTKLLAQGYISAEMAQQRESEFLEQKNRLEALERDRISIAREIMVQRAELAALPLRQNSQLAQIKRLLTNTDQEWAESEGKRRIAVIAPESGIATTVTAEVGQTVDGTRSMVSVIPNGAKLQAYLYAPSRAIGFVKEGDPVLLRYQAYPYQKFGHVRGTIVGVSRIALLPGEITGIQMSNFTTGEPFYRIIVSLRSQSINTYGKRQELQAGMLLDADILLEERKIYEWALEPLYSLTGKL
jgi:membrane fusion protein